MLPLKKRSTKGYHPPIKKKRKKRNEEGTKTKLYSNLFAVALVLSLFTFLGFLTPHLLKVDQVICHNQYGDCSTAITDKLMLADNATIFQVKKEIEKALDAEILVSDYSLSFKFPSKVEVNVIERKVNFALYSSNDKKFALVDKVGRVIAVSNSTNLTFCQTEKKIPAVGESVDPQTLFSLQIAFDVNSLYKTNSSSIKGDSLVIELNYGPEVILPQEGDKDLLLGSLSLILGRLNSLQDDFTIEGKEDKTVIDLRFAKPIIRFKDYK